MRRITHKGETVYETKQSIVSYPELYEAVTGTKANRQEWIRTGTLEGMSYTDFLKANELEVEAWDNL